jgi:hypothetical protein
MSKLYTLDSISLRPESFLANIIYSSPFLASSLFHTIVLRDKILYRRFENGSEEIDQMIVPSRLRQSVLKELHSGIGGGHLGIAGLLFTELFNSLTCLMSQSSN